MKGNTPDPGGGQGDERGDPGWVTARDAARQLGAPPRQLYNLIDRGGPHPGIRFLVSPEPSPWAGHWRGESQREAERSGAS